jgi:hypothetical protein
MSDIRVVPHTRLKLRFGTRPWRFAEERRADIDAHFKEVKASRSGVWNGRVLLLHSWGSSDAVFDGIFFETDFASFLAWRDWDFPDPAVTNSFAMGALRARDGAFLLGVMAPHTSNAGRIYFPSGTPDPDDIVGDAVDLNGSLWREIAEETGLTAEELVAEPGWHTVFAEPRIAQIKVLQADETADALRARILQHLSRQQQPELCDIRIVRGPSDFDSQMPDFIIAFFDSVWR